MVAGLAVLALVAVLDAVVTGDRDDLVRAAIGLVVARTFYWLLWWLHSAGMGFGDVRLAALLGFPLAWLGWEEFALGMYSGFRFLWLLSMIAQSDIEGRDLSSALEDGDFPISVNLLDGGYGILYGEDGSFVSNSGGGGTLEIHSVEDGTLTACFDFTAEGTSGTVDASGGVHAAPE